MNAGDKMAWGKDLPALRSNKIVEALTCIKDGAATWRNAVGEQLSMYAKLSSLRRGTQSPAKRRHIQRKSQKHTDALQQIHPTATATPAAASTHGATNVHYSATTHDPRQGAQPSPRRLAQGGGGGRRWAFFTFRTWRYNAHIDDLP